MALAHASERAVLLTLPTGPFIAGAALAVLVTAVAGSLAARLPAFGARRLLTWRTPRDWGSWAGFVLLCLLLLAGVFGSRDPFHNPLPLTLWTVAWIALVLASALFGDLWRPVAPWRGPVRLVRRLMGRSGGIGLSRLGYWPAVAGYFAFAWFEIVSLAPDDPLVLARVVGLYWLAIFLLAVAEGEDWLDRGEMLTAYFALVSKIAPLWRESAGGRTALMAGLPGAQIAAMPPMPPSRVALLLLLIAGVSFDGFSETFRWLALIDVNPLEFPGRSAVMVQNTLGLIAAWAVVAATILGAVAAGRGAPAGPMLLSFLPIATGYHLAHYLVALLTQGQYVIAALNDPLGRNWALLGLPDHWVSFGFLSHRPAVWAVWTAQFALILGAHLLSVILALRLAAGAGLRAHLPATLLMVGYTVFGLWMLSAAAAG